MRISRRWRNKRIFASTRPSRELRPANGCMEATYETCPRACPQRKLRTRSKVLEDGILELEGGEALSIDIIPCPLTPDRKLELASFVYEKFWASYRARATQI